MRIACLSTLMLLLFVSTAFAQRDAPVWETYLPKIAIYHDEINSQFAITVDFIFRKDGGPIEHSEHQAYLLAYLKKDEEQKLGEIPLNDKHNKIGDL